MGVAGAAFGVDGGVGRLRACRRAVDGPRCDATSACVYIWFGVRLVGVFPVAVFFSAFWLRSSVVSVLISLISGIQVIDL